MQRNWEVSGHVTAAVAVYNAAVNIPSQADEADAHSVRGKLVPDHTELASCGVVEAIEQVAKEEPAVREDWSIRCGRTKEEEVFGYGPWF